MWEALDRTEFNACYVSVNCGVLIGRFLICIHVCLMGPAALSGT
jgi:hypothetical protein